MKKLLCLLIFLTVSTWARGDINITSPYEGEEVTGTINLKVQEPKGNPPVIRVSLVLEREYDKDQRRDRDRDRNRDRDRTVWKGELRASDNYTTTIDTKTFPKGEYELKLSYRDEYYWYNGYVDLYIN
ncbi:MAG: hypothetical protein ACRCY4_03380 [Brevinema sp.]